MGSDTLRIARFSASSWAWGRGIRNAGDHCAVILIGNTLALSLIDKADRHLFSPATR